MRHAETESYIVDKGGVESAIGTGVEPVSTQETTEEGSGESSISQYEEGEGVMRFMRKA